jgi:hypothetical protein
MGFGFRRGTAFELKTPYNNVYNSVALQSLILTTVQSCKSFGMRKVLQSIATEIIYSTLPPIK